jgi:hypothetical protein
MIEVAVLPGSFQRDESKTVYLDELTKAHGADRLPIASEGPQVPP